MSVDSISSRTNIQKAMNLMCLLYTNIKNVVLALFISFACQPYAFLADLVYHLLYLKLGPTI